MSASQLISRILYCEIYEKIKVLKLQQNWTTLLTFTASRQLIDARHGA